METRSPVPLAQRRLKFQDNSRLNELYNERYAVLSHGHGRAGAVHSFDNRKTSPISRGLKVDEHDYCISKSPGYLGPMDSGGSLQDTGLNIGVLDCDLVEKWKQNQRGTITDSNSRSLKQVPGSASKVYSVSYASLSNQQSSLCSDLSITSTVGFAQGQSNKERIICLLSPPKPVSDDRIKLTGTDRLTGRDCVELRPVRDKPKGSTLGLKDKEFNINLGERRPAGVYKTKKVLDMLERSYTNKNFPRPEDYSEIMKTMSNTKNVEGPGLPKNSAISVPKMDNRMEKWPKSSAKLSDGKSYHEKPENIIVLGRRHASASLTYGEFRVPESHILSEEDDVLSHHSTSSDLVSSEGCSSLIVGSTFSLSSPLPDTSKLSRETASDPKIQPEDKAFKMVLSPQTPNQVTRDQVAPSSRHPSPLRQLSNGFSRMRRSLSLKDNTVVSLPRSSVQFPKGAGGASPLNLDNNQANAANRGRSSPLRRLIDPLLKPKLAITSPYSDQLSKTVYDVPASSAKFSQMESNKTATVQALLQYSTKRGLPMFKLVSKKKGDALVATLANTFADGKHGLNLNFTLYSVSEMKKNSSWIHHGMAGKDCGYLYNIVGQMKIRMLACDTSDKGSFRELFTVIESTLFGVQQSKSDQETMKVKPGGELAAIVVKTPKGNLRNYGVKSNDSEDFLKVYGDSLLEDSLNNWLGSIKKSSATVILPAGVHSMPNKGTPSPLLHRWRSGGSCDCEGWDVGCNLSFLCQSTERCQECPDSEAFQLFSKEPSNGKDPSFRLTPFNKGIYAMEFNPSTTSDLQAFFISITVLSTQAALRRSDNN